MIQKNGSNIPTSKTSLSTIPANNMNLTNNMNATKTNNVNQFQNVANSILTQSN